MLTVDVSHKMLRMSILMITVRMMIPVTRRTLWEGLP